MAKASKAESKELKALRRAKERFDRMLDPPFEEDGGFTLDRDFEGATLALMEAAVDATPEERKLVLGEPPSAEPAV